MNERRTMITMTMKDKLDKLLTDNDIIGNQELYEELVNDLEVLEIVKKLDIGKKIDEIITCLAELKGEDYKKLKEWLK